MAPPTKTVARSEIDDAVIAVLDLFHRAPGLPSPTAKLWDIGIGPNALSALTIPLSKISAKYGGLMVMANSLGGAKTVKDVLDLVAKAVTAGGEYKVKS